MNNHNGAKFLKKSVKSVLNQSYKNWEIIFWDNFSKDESKQIIQNFKEKERDLLLFMQQRAKRKESPQRAFNTHRAAI